MLPCIMFPPSGILHSINFSIYLSKGRHFSVFSLRQSRWIYYRNDSSFMSQSILKAESAILAKCLVNYLWLCGKPYVWLTFTVFLHWSFCERKHRTDNYKAARSNFLNLTKGVLDKSHGVTPERDPAPAMPPSTSTCSPAPLPQSLRVLLASTCHSHT